jgi:hypothetical protein
MIGRGRRGRRHAVPSPLAVGAVTVHRTVSLSKDDDEALVAFASRYNLPISEVIRNVVHRIAMPVLELDPETYWLPGEKEIVEQRRILREKA